MRRMKRATQKAHRKAQNPIQIETQPPPRLQRVKLSACHALKPVASSLFFVMYTIALVSESRYLLAIGIIGSTVAFFIYCYKFVKWLSPNIVKLYKFGRLNVRDIFENFTENVKLASSDSIFCISIIVQMLIQIIMMFLFLIVVIILRLASSKIGLFDDAELAALRIFYWIAAFSSTVYLFKFFVFINRISSLRRDLLHSHHDDKSDSPDN